ncbi:Bacterial alpha-L-rhamnosidase [Aquisphaera giovannonii]|uniref:alpha-L-rhamnosidase n=1 Tax=Aquisphaera giovannonii TaxID=406548 RepID=A0A5B9WDH6_9BACT|nr:family 78 glycoside hydrolase catalytic domain [Aquisphaera giovannonii]QEH38718.1 Bacterial alpha-L-rhamnosidase [Aquisphaera giovannonii]
MTSRINRPSRTLAARGLAAAAAALAAFAPLLAAPAEASAAAESGPLRPANLRCESKVDPMGVDVARPRLSWIVTSEGRGQVQTAYRILVASGPAALARDEGDFWDSGKVDGAHTIAIEYAGKPLASDQRAAWKVMVWDRDGKPSAWSAPASWSAGLLKPEDWKAQWIGVDHPAAPKAEPGKEPTLLLTPAPYLRASFEVKKPVRTATVYTTALGIHDVHLNGARVTDDSFNPGWTDYAKRVYYRAYDVTPRIRQGANAIGAILADGWYSGYVGFGKNRDHYGHLPRIKTQLNLVYEDGTAEVVATGPSWKAATGPLLEADFLQGEAYDARKELPGWDAPGYDDSGWGMVQTGAEVSPVVQAHPGPAVRPFAEIPAATWEEPKPGVYVANLGQNLAGVVRLKVKGEPGRKITLRFSERLNPDRTIYTTNLRSARCVDTYVCKGAGEEVWTPRFTFHGFQYVELTGLATPPTSDTVTAIALSSDTPVVGQFACSDPMLNKLHSNAYWTQRANFIDIPTDCPQRDERLGWTGDAQVYIRTATLNCDVQAFFNKWLVDLTDGQRADGQFPMVAPVKVAGDDGGPAWADAGVICPWTIYQVYGDRRVLERQYPSMVRFVEFCRARCTPAMLPPDKFHCFGDWLSIGADTPKDVIFAAYFAISARDTAKAAEALRKHEDAEKYRELFSRIKAAFHRAYMSADGRIKGDTQAVYVLAIAADLVDGEDLRRAGEYLVEDIEKKGNRLSTGFIGTKDLMLVLSKIGRVDVAYGLLLNTSFPSWGFSIKQGATSIWERWDGWTPEKGFQDPGMNSFAHYSFGAVYQWMVENIGGIKSDAPAYKHIVIEPRPGGKLEHADTLYKSVRGDVVTSWAVKEGEMSLVATIPANTTATVILPASDTAAITESSKPVARAEGVRVKGTERGKAVLEVGSGTYAFAVKLFPGVLEKALMTPVKAADQAGDGFVALFNGNDLSGWHGEDTADPRKVAAMSADEKAKFLAKGAEDAKKHWRVDNGEIVNDGDGAYLTTDRAYGDIELYVDFKIGPKGDSGVYLRGTPQVQVWDSTEPSYVRFDAQKGSGGLWNNSPGKPGKDPLVNADKPIGEWNTLHIIQVGSRTTIYLNDKLVVDNAIMENYWDRSTPIPAAAPIQLQTHGHEIRWRNIKVREIPGDEANTILSGKGAKGFTSIFNGKDFTGWKGPVDNYQVKDGAIVCKPGHGGTIYHEKELKDFVARVEFRLPPGGNNGLAIRYPGEGDTAYVGMTELQVLDNTAEQYRNLDKRQYHGSAYGMAAAKVGYLRPVGQWNYQEVTVQGSKIKVELNGTVILDTDLSKAKDFMAGSAHPGKDRTSGYFGFAGHNDAVEFRAISIRPLKEGEDADGFTDLFDGRSLDGWEIHGGKSKYRVQDGNIVGVTDDHAANTFLCKGDFKDFLLEAEVKDDPRLNSGFQVRSHVNEHNVVQGPQCEVALQSSGTAGRFYDEGRRGKWLCEIPDAAKAAFDDRGWNRYKILVQGNRYRSWVNGVPCSDFTDDADGQGFIGLQVHAIPQGEGPYEVRWRNLRIRELQPGEKVEGVD